MDLSFVDQKNIRTVIATFASFGDDIHDFFIVSEGEYLIARTKDEVVDYLIPFRQILAIELRGKKDVNRAES